MIGVLFKFWYAVGLLLMATFGVPDFLAFSNGLFLVFFALYAFDLERQLGEPLAGRIWRVLLVGGLTFGVEWLGVATGFPFGGYEYTPLLGVAVLGVPLAIACAWVGVVYTAVLLADGGSRWGRAIQVGAYTVLLDLVLDPVAHERAFWSWAGESGYYGVPAVNFASWFVVSAAMSLLFPLRPSRPAVRRNAARLMQMMLFMFGILGMLDALWWPAIIAAAGIAAVEGVVRHHSGRAKQAIQ